MAKNPVAKKAAKKKPKALKPRKQEKQKIGPWQDAWLRTLESGKFRQGKLTLACRPFKSDGWQFCCLGLACEVAIENGVKIGFKEDRFGVGSYWGHTQFLPPGIEKLFGFRSQSGMIGLNSTLTEKNDVEGWSFKKIAAFCRKHPEKVFAKPK